MTINLNQNNLSNEGNELIGNIYEKSKKLTK